MMYSIAGKQPEAFLWLVGGLMSQIARSSARKTGNLQRHSANYGFRVPANVPIITVSRHTMVIWGNWFPIPCYFTSLMKSPPSFVNHHRHRDIDVLVQARKSSRYLLTQLIPRPCKNSVMFWVVGFVDNLADVFNRFAVYLYDSAEYWAQQRVTEGFGLPPLEAMACGCHLFSSLNHALADYLDPAFNCHKIAGYALEYDVYRILEVLKTRSASWSYLQTF